MNRLLENQKIGKRRSYSQAGQTGSGHGPEMSRGFPSLKPQKPAFRPAGIVTLFEQNSRFIDKVKQNPVKIPSRRKRAARTEASATARGNRPSASSFRDFFVKAKEAEHDRPVHDEQRQAETRPLTFSIPVVPVAALLLLVLGAFFIVYNHDSAFDWTRREVVSPGSDPNSAYNLGRYAGLSPVVPSMAENAAETHEEDKIPIDITETFAWQNYRVKRGDTVSGIAQYFSLSMDAIIASNGITNARALREGETLRIPNMDGIPYTVKSGDSLSGISNALGVPLEAILDANDLQSDVIHAGTTLFIPGARMNRDDLRMAMGDLFIYPVRGARLSSPFGWRNDPFTGARRFHAAIDLAAPQGTPVMAAMDGTISATGFDRNLGNYIIINHSGGFQTSYAHLHTVGVRRGDRVRQGAQIGTVGSTGYSTGPHLHFVVYRNGREVNPLDLLNPRS